MLNLSGKQRTSTTTFLLPPNEEALLSGPDLGGGSLRFTTFTPSEGSNIDQEMQATLADGVATIKLPLLQQGSFATTVDLQLGDAGKLSARIAGQPLGGQLMVHVDIYLDRGLNFAQR